MAETTVWIDADGGSTTLDVEWDTSGRFMPPIAFEDHGVPGQPGLRLDSVRHRDREFVLPIWLDASSESALRTAMRDLVAKMDPTRGDGKIRVTSPTGDQREITCRVASGLELSERLGSTSGPTVQRAVVVFRAHDPYWTDTSDIIDTYTTGQPATFFPLFPLRLTSSEIFAAATVNNDGDVEAWPRWQITGPGSAFALRNLTTGKLLQLTTGLGGGETATIDTRPGAKTVVKNDGTNLFPDLSSDTSLWPLARGSNSIQVEMPGATSASEVRLTWRRRYLSA
jgi:hypothetical protein